MNNKAKKEPKKVARVDGQTTPGVDGDAFAAPASKADLKAFLNLVRDRMTDGAASPIYAAATLQHVLNMPQIYDWLDNENKEIARDIWLRIKQAGTQMRNPPMLFGPDEQDLGSAV
jgi:hypothetical protein